MIATITRSINSIIEKQNDDGSWNGIVSSPPITNCIYILFIHYLEFNTSDEYNHILQKLSDYILSARNNDGYWSLFPGGETDLSLTLMCYFALKLSGRPVSSDYMTKVQDYICNKYTSVKRLHIWDEILLTIMGQIPLSVWTTIPEWIMAVPEFLPCYHDIPSLLKPQIITLSMVLHKKGIFYPDERYCLQEFEGIFGIHYKKKSPLKSQKKKNKALFSPAYKVLQWLRQYRDNNGMWYGNTSITLFSLAALKNIKEKIYIDDSEYNFFMSTGCDAIKSLGSQRINGIFQTEVNCDVWDTAHMIMHLQQYPERTMVIDTAIQKGIQWLRSKQSSKKGIWHRHNKKGIPGGWAFESDNEYSPDADDTSIVLNILQKEKLTDTQSYKNGLLWLTSNINPDGGFALFERKGIGIFNFDPFFKLLTYNYPMYLNNSLPEMSARIGLMLLENKHADCEHTIKKITLFLLNHISKKRNDFMFTSTWFTNYIFGTSSVYRFFLQTNANIPWSVYEKVNNWFTIIQNPDGGWGESPLSHREKKYIPYLSSPLLTAEVLLFKYDLQKIYSSEYLKKEKSAIVKALNFIIKNQNETGGWNEPAFVNNYIPELGWHCNFGNSTEYYPLTALHTFKDFLDWRNEND